MPEATGPDRPTRILFCWDVISGFIVSCWNELQSRPNVDLRVFAISPAASLETAFSADLVAGLNGRLLEEHEPRDARRLESLVAAEKPDVVFVSGWRHRGFRHLFRSERLGWTQFVLMMDNPLRNDWRQRLGRFRIGPILRRADFVFVPGERGRMLAKFWKVPDRKIRRGLLGVDYAGLSGLHAERRSLPGGWPRSFRFIGRYHPRKGIDVQVEAYRAYRGRVSDPWPLRCCGMGPLGHLLRSEGIFDEGFVQPGRLAEPLRDSGVFLLPSRYDAWPLAIVEGCAAGLPILCTEACGSSVELVRPYYNGVSVPPEDVDALTEAMLWFHSRYDRLPEMGAASQHFAAAYSAEAWADRVVEMLNALPPR